MLTLRPFARRPIRSSGKVAVGIVLALGLVSCTSLPSDGAVSAKAVSAEAAPLALPTDSRPNIIIIYIDDLGYGDLSSYGATRVSTPNVDKMANGGVKLTDAHSSSATCTPSRYSLLTGEYAFRNNARVLPGDAAALIKPGKPTLPLMLKGAGYTTGVVGKWHLGLGDGSIDWNGKVAPGPLEIGFDYSFLLPATGDRVPTVYLEGHRVIGADPDDPITVSYREKVGNRPTGEENPELARFKADRGHNKTIVNGVPRIGYMGGGEAALWVDEDFHTVFTEKAVNFIRANKDRPFFLFHSFHDIHVPRLPHPRFQGKSQMGWRGDAIVQMDWMTGQIMQELEALGIAEDTLIIFTSDNGPVMDDGYADGAVDDAGDHKPAGPFRGTKYSIYEGGTRVPTIWYWPGSIAPRESTALVSQVDFYASIAELVGVDLGAGEAVDSQNHSAALTGRNSIGREYLFSEAVAGTSLRRGSMKYVAPLRKGARQPPFLIGKGLTSGTLDTPQLYNLATDPSEAHNIVDGNPDVANDLQMKLDAILASPQEGR